MRNRLKMLGAVWKPAKKCWQLPLREENIENLQAMGFLQDGQTNTESELPAREGDGDWTVGTLCKRVAQVIDSALPQQIWLVGEVVQARQNRGHWWIELADPIDIPTQDGHQLIVPDQGERAALGRHRNSSSLTAVLWSGVYKRLLRARLPETTSEDTESNLPLQEGLQVRFLVHLEFRTEGGRLQIVIDDVDLEYTQGQLALTKERILSELKKRGLLELNRQRVLRPFPLRIALITADVSRARNDFLDELERSGLSFSVSLFDSRMQGEETASDVSQILHAVRTGSLTSEQRAFDVVVITRGGGSRSDLRWFDDLEIAKEIAYADIPVITAIGHHEDESIADRVAFKAEKTPTAAAHFLVQRCLESLSLFLDRTIQASLRGLERLQRMGSHLERRLDAIEQAALRSLGRKKQKMEFELDRRLDAIEQAALRNIERKREALNGYLRLIQTIQQQNQQILKRGYALLTSLGQKQIQLTADDFSLEEYPKEVWIRMESGRTARKVRILAEIKQVREEENE